MLKWYISVIFYVGFVWHNETDSRIGFHYNNSEANLTRL